MHTCVPATASAARIQPLKMNSNQMLSAKLSNIPLASLLKICHSWTGREYRFQLLLQYLIVINNLIQPDLLLLLPSLFPDPPTFLSCLSTWRAGRESSKFLLNFCSRSYFYWWFHYWFNFFFELLVQVLLQLLPKLLSQVLTRWPNWIIKNWSGCCFLFCPIPPDST